MSETRVSDQPCLDCGKIMNAVSSIVDDAAPRPGDITICMYCGHVMSFDDKLNLCVLSDQQMLDIAGDRQILAFQMARAQAMKDYKNKK